MSKVHLLINGKPVQVPEGSTVAVAIANAGIHRYRSSVAGEARAPLCGMGICFECRVTINDLAHCLSCQIICEAGMKVVTS